jgi:putative ABC transport system substrate-binding protein
MLTEMAPSVRRAALMFIPKTNAYYHAYVRELGAAPNRLTSDYEVVDAPVRDQAEIKAAIAAIARDPGGGLIGAADVFNVTHRRLIISLAERYQLPALYFNQYFVTEGGLMSYGPDTTDIFRQTAKYIDRISTLVQRFACARLSQSCLTGS